ncbi:hypothetical protein FKP32DRAFT_1544453, partial [Trametes sanguinea]
ITGIEALLAHKGLWDIASRPVSDTHPVGSNNVWEEFCCMHQARGFGTGIALLCNSWRMAKKPNQTMTSWIADVRGTACTPEEIDAPIVEEHAILILTSGLPDMYSQVIVSLDSTPKPETDLSLEHVIQRLINEAS